MRRSALYLAAATLCCLQASTETSGHWSRSRRQAPSDGLALSREIFRNISQQLRQSMTSPTADKLRHVMQNKVDEPRFRAQSHHHEHHWGPYFESESGQAEPAPVSAHVGSEALLSCRVGMLKDKTVMWLRRTADAVQLLTVGSDAHSGDQRVKVRFQYPNNWRLSIAPLQWSDAGLYMCQISTHPPRAILANLTVLAPILTINGDETHEIKDRYYKTGSSIELSCTISAQFPQQPITTTTSLTTTVEATPAVTTIATTEPVRTSLSNMIEVLNKSWSIETTTTTESAVPSTTTVKLKTTKNIPATTTIDPSRSNPYGLVWKKQGKEINYGVTLANVSSTFAVASASHNDSGTYSCHLQDHASASLNVHVLTGENQAAVHHDTGNIGLFWKPRPTFFFTFFVMFVLLK